MRQTIQQILEQLRSQKVLTAVNITGTALSILLIMVIVMIQEVKVLPFAPESNRNRFMHVSAAILAEDADENCYSSGPLSYSMAEEMCGKLGSAEITSIYAKYAIAMYAETPGQPTVKSYTRPVDHNYWDVFDLTFIDGKPFDEAAFGAGSHVAVIDASTARRLFGTEKATGRNFLLDYKPYVVCGVVKDVTKLAKKAFANIWIPATGSALFSATSNKGLMGGFVATIMAKDRNDFDKITAEFNNRLATINTNLSRETGKKFNMLNRPYNQEKEASATWSNEEPDLNAERRSRLMLYTILLIIPAINLSGMTESRLRRRVEEIGLRRAFGCRRNRLMVQLIGENLAITVSGGIIGWILSVMFAISFSSSLFSEDFFDTAADIIPRVDVFMLVNTATFGWTLLFCFILNLLSSGIPAWKASRTSIVNAINRR